MMRRLFETSRLAGMVIIGAALRRAADSLLPERAP